MRAWRTLGGITVVGTLWMLFMADLATGGFLAGPRTAQGDYLSQFLHVMTWMVFTAGMVLILATWERTRWPAVAMASLSALLLLCGPWAWNSPALQPGDLGWILVETGYEPAVTPNIWFGGSLDELSYFFVPHLAVLSFGASVLLLYRMLNSPPSRRRGEE